MSLERESSILLSVVNKASNLPSKAETLLSLHKVNLEWFQVLCAMASVGGMQVHLHRYNAASAMTLRVRSLAELNLTLLSPFTTT